jgi:signal transduction histidine kinase
MIDPDAADTRRLRTYLLANLVGLGSAVVCLPLVGLTVVTDSRSRELWTDVAILALSFVVLSAGWLAVRARRFGWAVVACMVANWTAALGTTYATPWLAPVNELAVLLPVMVMFMFLPRRLLTLMVGLAVAIAGAVAALSELRPNTIDPPDRWLAATVVIVFVPIVATIITVGVRHAYQRLAERAEQLRVSRARVVVAGDAVRRRLEQDLHDGIQHRLVSMSIRLNRVGQLVTGDPDRVAAAVAELSRELEQAIDDLREVSHGIYPPLLAARGLGPALASAIRRLPLPVTLEADGVQRYPADVETAVYFCCLEALQNVVKHARATNAEVTIVSGPDLRFTVADDGLGFAANAGPDGAGIANMADRIGSIGGAVEIRSAPGRGTVVVGAVPISGAAVATAGRPR